MSVPPASPLRAPFPWFGGKSRVASEIWARLGEVVNYVEPFAGSLAVLLARPHLPRVETVNDRDAHMANFWRAIQTDPDGVACYADWPVNEVDLHARHRWLVTTGAQRVARLERDPDAYDVKVAGWWVWGVCAWIAGGWCQRPRQSATDSDTAHRLPHLSTPGMGIHRSLRQAMGDELSSVLGTHDMEAAPEPMLPHSIPHLGTNRGVHRRRLDTMDTFRRLSERLRHVRVTCGDWTRVMGESVTFRHGLTDILLDPPYAHAERALVYAVDEDVSTDVRTWAIANGENPLLRIALCGYDGEHAMPSSWTCLAWKSSGGYGSQGHRERVWFSPACLPVPREQVELFDATLPLGADESCQHS